MSNLEAVDPGQRRNHVAHDAFCVGPGARKVAIRAPPIAFIPKRRRSDILHIQGADTGVDAEQLDDSLARTFKSMIKVDRMAQKKKTPMGVTLF